MPTYDYACKACDHRFEAFQSMKDDVLVTCPACGTNALQRLIGAGAGLVFKGSGFYLTDYKKSGGSGTVSSPAAASSATTTSTNGNGSASSSGSSGETSPSSAPSKADSTT